MSELVNNTTIRLGELIAKLIPLYRYNQISFDFGGFVPFEFNSWRGSYDQLAIAYQKGDTISVLEFLNMCENICGKTLTGSKGGEYVMNYKTPVWVDLHDECTYTGIIDVVAVDSEEYKIVTSHCVF